MSLTTPRLAATPSQVTIDRSNMSTPQERRAKTEPNGYWESPALIAASKASAQQDLLERRLMSNLFLLIAVPLTGGLLHDKVAYVYRSLGQEWQNYVFWAVTASMAVCLANVVRAVQLKSRLQLPPSSTLLTARGSRLLGYEASAPGTPTPLSQSQAPRYHKSSPEVWTPPSDRSRRINSGTPKLSLKPSPRPISAPSSATSNGQVVNRA